jgi:hypothetical protein
MRNEGFMKERKNGEKRGRATASQKEEERCGNLRVGLDDEMRRRKETKRSYSSPSSNKPPAGS